MPLLYNGHNVVTLISLENWMMEWLVLWIGRDVGGGGYNLIYCPKGMRKTMKSVCLDGNCASHYSEWAHAPYMPEASPGDPALSVWNIIKELNVFNVVIKSLFVTNKRVHNVQSLEAYEYVSWLWNINLIIPVFRNVALCCWVHGSVHF